jgi:hypothetical protein
VDDYFELSGGGVKIYSGENVVFTIDKDTQLITSSAPTVVTEDSDATSTTTGSLRTAGGAAVVKDLWVGGNIHGSMSEVLSAGSYITATGAYDGGTARTFAVDATELNIASKVVARDTNGDFAAGTITADLIGNVTGNADTATTVTNGVYTTDTGTVTNTMLAGSIANDKLANSTISGVSLGSDLEALTAGSYLTSAGTYTGGTARTFAVDATTAATADKVVARDSNGDFAAGTITADLIGNVTGNADTATTATTATNLAAATGILAGTLNVDPPAVTKNNSVTATYTLTGLTTSHKIIIMSQDALPDRYWITAAWASATNTLSIQFHSGNNTNPGAIDIAYFAWV